MKKREWLMIIFASIMNIIVVVDFFTNQSFNMIAYHMAFGLALSFASIVGFIQYRRETNKLL